MGSPANGCADEIPTARATVKLDARNRTVLESKNNATRIRREAHASLHRVALTLQTRGARLGETSLLLLRSRRLLLLGRIRGGRVLFAACRTPCHRTCRRASPGVVADDLTDNCPSHCTLGACTGSGPSRGRRRLCRGRCRGWFRWIVASLLDRPRITGCLVGFLLLRALPLGGEDVLLCA